MNSRVAAVAERALLPLPRAFYDRKTERVARELVGCLIVRHTNERRIVARIVETEAYVGAHDLACHAAKGLTPRTQVMFGPPGHAYVYLIYGMYHCLNVVTEGEGQGAAVLIRALEPLEGLLNDGSNERTDGPGKLCRVLQIDKTLNCHDLTRHDLTQPSQLWISAPPTKTPVKLARGPRIGVDYAGAWAQKPLRFWQKDNGFVSKARTPTNQTPTIHHRRSSCRLS